MKKNEFFKCINCGEYNPPAKFTCRNHCRKCFVSLHVDEKIPGDRKSNCKGLMYPISYIFHPDEIKILFKCSKCGKEHWNKSAIDDKISQLDFYINFYKKFF